jgi:hypothetical protein
MLQSIINACVVTPFGDEKNQKFYPKKEKSPTDRADESEEEDLKATRGEDYKSDTGKEGEKETKLLYSNLRQVLMRNVISPGMKKTELSEKDPGILMDSGRKRNSRKESAKRSDFGLIETGIRSFFSFFVQQGIPEIGIVRYAPSTPTPLHASTRPPCHPSAPQPLHLATPPPLHASTYTSTSKIRFLIFLRYFSMLSRQLRLAVLEELPAHTPRSLVSELRIFPNPDGSRYSSETYDKIWLSRLAEMYVLESEFREIVAKLAQKNPTKNLRIPRISVRSVFLHEEDEGQVRYLNPLLILELKKVNAINVEGL